MMALLQQADSVFVNFDPRREGVLVPPQLKRQPRVVLQYGMNMAIPIPDLDVGADGIGATLSFDRSDPDATESTEHSAAKGTTAGGRPRRTARGGHAQREHTSVENCRWGEGRSLDRAAH